MKEEDINKLWVSYSKDKNNEAKKQLIEEYSPLVKYVASRLRYKFDQYIDYDDLVGFGVFGLLDAIEKYDYNMGYKFETYASIRIRGSIIDSIRKLDWVPRTTRQQHKEFERINEEFMATHERKPNNQELSEILNIPVEEVDALVKKNEVLSLVSLDDVREKSNGEIYIADNNLHNSPEKEYDAVEVKKLLVDAISSLNEKEQFVINMYYNDKLNLKEISVCLNVSESRISQIHSKALSKLEAKLGDYKDVLFN